MIETERYCFFRRPKFYFACVSSANSGARGDRCVNSMHQKSDREQQLYKAKVGRLIESAASDQAFENAGWRQT